MPANMRGNLRRNLRKEEGSKQPDMKGMARIGDTEYWISGWVNSDDTGKWLSLSFEKREQQPQPRQTVTDLKDDLPW